MPLTTLLTDLLPARKLCSQMSPAVCHPPSMDSYLSPYILLAHMQKPDRVSAILYTLDLVAGGRGWGAGRDMDGAVSGDMSNTTAGAHSDASQPAWGLLMQRLG